MKSGFSGLEYAPKFSGNEQGDASSEIVSLTDQRRRKEIALRRLKSLFLYGDDDIPEKDFIIERKQLIDDINAIDARLTELNVDNANSTVLDDTFAEKASYFIMVDQLLKGDCSDPVDYIRNIDLSVVKSFLQTIIRKIIIANGKVLSIQFRNGTSLEFVYA